MKNKKQKQLSLFSTKQLGKKNNLKLKPISDEAVKNILSDFRLVSSRQLALILSKKNDDCLRVARCENRGFTWYKDKDGNVYYNLPEVMREIGIGVNA